MKKILKDGDSIVIDGKEISYNELIRYLTERIAYKRQIEFIQTSFNTGGVANE